MALGQILADFKTSVVQCDSLIANAHRQNAGVAILPAIDQQQITVAAFLNMFIAWEAFLEGALVDFMVGETTLNGSVPVKYVSPSNPDAARAMIKGTLRFFDYGSHNNLRTMVSIYFQHGYPFEPHLGSIEADLSDLKTLRNASAHISASTQQPLESLAVRLFGQPHPGISLYRFLTMIDPRAAPAGTVFVTYRDKLSTAADLITQG